MSEEQNQVGSEQQRKRDRKNRLVMGGVAGTSGGTGLAIIVYKVCVANGVQLTVEEAILMAGAITGWGTTFAICMKQIFELIHEALDAWKARRT